MWRTHAPSSRLLVWAVGAVFLLATRYCVCEAFAGGFSHAESSHQHATPGRHDDGAPTSDTASDPCCATLQAIVTPQTTILLSAASQLLFRDVALPAVSRFDSANLSLAASGLSPPAREPTRSRPFYRTTFASHAPPVCLA